MGSTSEPDEEVILVEDDVLELPCEDGSKFHCIATWEIKNYGCCQLECGEQLTSPMFSAGPTAKVKWYLAIFPNGQEKFQEYVSIHVIFVQSTESVESSCRVSIIDSESNAWMTDRIDQNLSRFQFDTFVKRDQLFGEKNKIFPEDTLTIRCQICSFDRTVFELQLGSSEDERLRAFANDFKKLYESGKFSDVILETRDGSVLAHKAILSARSTVFAELFSEPHATCPVPNYDKETIDALMSYIYTGRVDSGLSLDLYEVAHEYGAEELTRLMSPSQISARTHITDETFTYTWRLRNFGSLDNDSQTIKYSQKFHTGPCSRAWSLSVCFNRIPNDDSDRYVGVYLNKLGSTGDKKNVHVRFSLCLVDREGQARHQAETEWSYKHPGRYGFRDLIRRSSLLQQRKDLLVGDTLTIRCNMTIFDGASISTVRHSFHSSDGVSDAEGLSSSLGQILRSGLQSDVTACTPEREFRLHRAVLCARSEVFADFFDNHGNGLSNYTINIQGIGADILELLFTFVYTGEMEEGPDCITAPGLLAAAEHYKIQGLRAICSDFIKHHACEILGGTSDAKTRDLVKDFICSNAEDVLTGEEWPRFVADHPGLASDILKSLSFGYRKTKRRRVE